MINDVSRVRDSFVPKTPLRLSLLTLLVASALAHAASTDQPTLTVNADASGSGDSSSSQQDSQDYAVKSTRAGTKLNLVPRDVPQSISVITEQRMKDQNLQNIGDALANTTGVTLSQIDSDRQNFFARGFYINNFQFDGIPATQSNVWDFGDASLDSSFFNSIEVVRGSTGLMSGSGNPSATVNMLRKHADSREFKGNVSASYGTWDNQRYVADLQAPLTESGNVRGRLIAGYQDQDSWMDRYHKREKFFNGMIDADLTDSTQLSVGYIYQESHTTDPSWGGMPIWYSNGTRVNYSRHFNAAPDWTFSDKEIKQVYATLTQNFANGWQARVNGTYTENVFNTLLMYGYGNPDQETGEGVVGYGGWNKGTRKVAAFDAYASGPFELFGRQHELMFGANYSRQHSRFFNSSPTETLELGDFNNWNGNVAYPEWSDWSLYSDDTIRQKSVYTAARFSLLDPLHLIAGARYTQYSTNGTTANVSKNDLTPYAGLVYDINDTWSAYASYTSIFQPQTERNTSGQYLDPIRGKTYETGLKSDWFNGRLTTSFSVFRTEEQNLGQSLSNTYVNGSTEVAYRQTKGVVSRGAEFEVNGALTDNWQMTFGAARYVAEERDGTAVEPDKPRTTLKLFTRYQPSALPDLTLGGGINWQSKIWADDAGGPNGLNYVEQGSYALVNLFGRYQVTKQLSAQVNLNNLFDKTYYSYLDSYSVYGAPRNVSVSLSYDF
ncbi:ferric-rhodotorulic acid/ferric-coprogen receptor FhuE [Pantoea sp. A4]|uniref:ferric-rhodotorulic acid/ferric-coprogen receptor FhuE n=1 Tax=Pantoea sp. A4 TaxID=1225184 RepID=UPI0003611F3D|nr:ferric-rhodotorulic acid/ferric-coprogen receptor FhuE [Pantoea sp. A4]